MLFPLVNSSMYLVAQVQCAQVFGPSKYWIFCECHDYLTLVPQIGRFSHRGHDQWSFSLREYGVPSQLLILKKLLPFTLSHASFSSSALEDYKIALLPGSLTRHAIISVRGKTAA